MIGPLVSQQNVTRSWRQLFALQKEGAGHRGDEGGPVYVDVGVLLLLLPCRQILGLVCIVGHDHVILGTRGVTYNRNTTNRKKETNLALGSFQHCKMILWEAHFQYGKFITFASPGYPAPCPPGAPGCGCGSPWGSPPARPPSPHPPAGSSPPSAARPHSHLGGEVSPCFYLNTREHKSCCLMSKLLWYLQLKQTNELLFGAV